MAISHWFKNAVVYCIDVDTFKDGNGDGIGDFIGLRQSLSYLAGLGVSCIWLLPFYPSPDFDYYVWRKDRPGDTSSEVVFPGKQKAVWQHDRSAKA
jgi:alpha amylase-like protein